MIKLEDLAIRYFTDKQCNNFRRSGFNIVGHCYTPLYEKFFEKLRLDNISLLEIGVQTGGSLMMWADYFENAKIYGIDDCSSIDEPVKTEYENQKVNFRKGSQFDKDFLLSVVKEVEKFNIIIDDGSHLSHHNIFSFETLFDYVKSGGFYVIEDLHCSCYPSYTISGLTTINYLHKLIDNMPSNIKDIHLYEKICFIEKL